MGYLTESLKEALRSERTRQVDPLLPQGALPEPSVSPASSRSRESKLSDSDRTVHLIFYEKLLPWTYPMQNLGIALSLLAKPNTGIRPQGTNHLEEEAGGKGQILHLPFLPLLFPVPA